MAERRAVAAADVTEGPSKEAFTAAEEEEQEEEEEEDSEADVGGRCRTSPEIKSSP